MGRPPTNGETSPWAPFEDRRRARDEKREAVLRTAVQLFLEVGYHRATLNEVAERLNITKPALYNYFASKEEILFECFRLGQAILRSKLDAIARSEGCGLDKLRAVIRVWAEFVTIDFGRALIRVDHRELSPGPRAEVRAGFGRIDAAVRGYVAQGIADRSIKDCDPKLTALAIAGAVTGIAQWYLADGNLSPGEIAESFTIYLTQGIEGRKSGKKARPGRAGKGNHQGGKDEFHPGIAARAANEPERPRNGIRRQAAHLARAR